MNPFGVAETGPAARRIRESAARGTLSHALALTGASPDILSRYALYMAAALECTATGTRPCGNCLSCRKVLRNIHPDVLTVRDEAHKFIAADVVRAARADAWIRPNEGARKVYCFPDCTLLTERDQNILLKAVEEGPPYAVFIFCAESGAALLDTLRSRCVEWRISPAEAGEKTGEQADIRTVPDTGKADGELARQGAELCRRIVHRHGAAAEMAVRLEKSKLSRETLADLLNWCYGAFAAALLSLYGRTPTEEYAELSRFLTGNLTKRQISSTMEVLREYAGQCAWNIGVGHTLGALAAEWEEGR